jgi:hypothetical protein
MKHLMIEQKTCCFWAQLFMRPYTDKSPPVILGYLLQSCYNWLTLSFLSIWPDSQPAATCCSPWRPKEPPRLIGVIFTNQALKWIILQMVDLIYSMLILLVPVSEGDMFWLCPLKDKQKLWIFVFRSKKVKSKTVKKPDRWEGKCRMHLSFICSFTCSVSILCQGVG